MQTHDTHSPSVQPQTGTPQTKPLAPRPFEVTYPGQDRAASPTNPFPRRPHEVDMGETVFRKPTANLAAKSEPESPLAERSGSLPFNLHAPDRPSPAVMPWWGVQTKLEIGQSLEQEAGEAEEAEAETYPQRLAEADTPPVQRQTERANVETGAYRQSFNLYAPDRPSPPVMPWWCQAKVAIGQPNDVYEQEADRVAEQVMSMAPPATPNVQRQVEADEPEAIQPKPLAETITPLVQRQEINLPPVPNYQLTPPSLLTPSASAPHQLGGQYPFRLNRQMQVTALQYTQQQLTPATLTPLLSQLSLDALALALTPPVGSAGAAPSATAPPAVAPTLSPPSPPPAPADAKPEAPRAASPRDVLKAVMAMPAIATAITQLQSQTEQRLRSDWNRLRRGEQVGVVSLAVVGSGAIAGIIASPDARQLVLGQLNGQVLPVPGINWLRVELNTAPDSLMMGLHLDVGALLPSILGFGPGSSSAIGGPPQPQPYVPGVQRAATSAAPTPQHDLESRLSQSQGRGSALPEEVRSFMEPRFGADFSQVRVHTGNDAVQMNRDLNAQAFTHKQDIYFSAGKAPVKDALTAHELTHVVQQTGAEPRNLATDQVQRVKATQTNYSIFSKNIIQRFESNEHKAMGDNATKDVVELAPKFQVTFGDLTAIADFFGSVSQIKELAKSELGLQQIKYVIYVKIRGQKEHESEFTDEVKNAVSKRYYTLAGNNYTHFTNPKEGDSTRDLKDKVNDEAVEKDEHGSPIIGQDGKPKKVPINNAGSYRRNHEIALKEAYDAGKKGTSKNEAMLYEGFASHFLTDAYAGGHMRPERISIKEHWDKKVPMFWINLKWWMAECIANHLNNQHGVPAAVKTEQQLWEAAQETFNQVVAAKGIPDLTFGDAISGAVHDYDNEKGVNAQVGNEVVKLVGDGAVLDEKNRLLAAGADTMAKAVAGVKASLQEVEMAYKGKEPSSILIDGLYRAEQLWPKPLANNDPKQDNKTLNWKVESVLDLLADPAMKEAIAKFANEKAQILGAEIQMEKPFKDEKELAMKEGALARLKGSPDSVAKTFTTILNYTPGSVASLGGVGGHDKDDNAVEYYQEVLKTKGGIESLTSEQRGKLIQDVLSGATMRDEQEMVANLLKTATSEQATKLIYKVGWHQLWEKIDGETCRQLVQTVGPSYWAKQSYASKQAEVKFLADGRTNDLAQETIIIILRTCTSEEVKLMDKQVGGFAGLSFDLDGRWNKEFKQMKDPVGDYPEPNKEVATA